MDFAKGIKRARERAGLSKRKLASLAGFDTSYIGLLESGRRTPSMEAMEAVALATRMPLGLLMLTCAEDKDLLGVSSEEAAALSNLLGVLNAEHR